MPSRVGTAGGNMTSPWMGDEGESPFSDTFDPGEDTSEGVESIVVGGNTGVVWVSSLLLLLGKSSREVELSFHLLVSSGFCDERSRS